MPKPTWQGHLHSSTCDKAQLKQETLCLGQMPGPAADPESRGTQKPPSASLQPGDPEPKSYLPFRKPIHPAAPPNILTRHSASSRSSENFNIPMKRETEKQGL